MTDWTRGKIESIATRVAKAGDAEAAKLIHDLLAVGIEAEQEAIDATTALEAAREDVARYQWLRSLDGSCDGPACVNFNIGFDWIEQHGEELDAAIDAARKAAGSES